MYEIRYIKVQFGERAILDLDVLRIKESGITAIIGESGSGKTSLLDILSLQVSSNATIYYNNDQFTDKDTFKRDYIYMVPQHPTFHNELTIKKHLEMIQTNVPKEEILEIIDLLSLQNSMGLYPKQLSGGERIRASILLAYLMQANILILDEPTASLDNENVTMIASVLSRYREKGHHIIVATHDKKIMDIADTIYEIKNQELLLLEEKETDSISQLKVTKSKLKSFWNTCLYSFAYNPKKRGIYIFLLSIIIGFSAVSFFSNNYGVKYQEKLIEEMSSSIITVFKKWPGEHFTNYDESLPSFTEGEMERLLSIEHVSKVEIAYETHITEQIDIYGNFIDQVPLTIYNEDDVIVDTLLGISLEEAEEEDFYAFSSEDRISLISYMDDEENLGENGVYLSKELADTIGYEHREGNVLKTNAYLYTHYIEGAIQLRMDEGEEILASSPVGVQKEIEAPILGVIEGYPKGDMYGNMNPSPIYISNMYLASLWKDIELVDTIFLTHADTSSWRPIEEGETLKCVKWEPNKLYIKVDSMLYVKDVLEELDTLGLGYYSEYADAQTAKEIINSRKESMLLFSGILLLGISISSVLMSKARGKDEQERLLFYRYYGYNSQERKKIKMYYYFFDMLCITILSSVCLFLCMYILDRLAICYTTFDIFMIPIVILLSSILTLCIPVFINRKNV